MWIIRSMRYMCIYMFVLCIKYLWEDTQEIDSDGCLCEGVLESGGENQEKISFSLQACTDLYQSSFWLPPAQA